MLNLGTSINEEDVVAVGKVGGVRSGTEGVRLRPGSALRLAVRSFRRRPGSAFAAVLTLALGIAAATTIYAVLHGFTRPLPVPAGTDVVQIQPLDARGGGVVGPGSEVLSNWADVPALSEAGAFRAVAPLVRLPGDAPVRVQAAELSPEVLPLLRVQALRGRLPMASGDEGSVEVLLSERTARSLFGSDEAGLGRTVDVGDRRAVIVGVMPDAFGFPYHQSLWWVSANLGRSPGGSNVSGDGEIELVGRVASGVRRSAAADQLTVRFDRVRRVTDPGAGPVRVEVKGFTRDRGEGGEVLALSALLGLVLLLVLVSATNVANLLLTRSEERAHLLTVHAALGAGPAQVALQLLGEALVLSLGGALLGLAAGAVAVDFIQRTLAPNWGYFWMRVAIDPSVVVFTLLLAFLVAVLSGAAPALGALRRDLSTALRAAAQGSGPRASKSSIALLTAQVAFSGAALVMALVMAFGLVRMARSGAALPRDEVVMGSVTLDSVRYPDRAGRAEARRLLSKALERTGARDAILSTGVPGFRSELATLDLEGRSSSPGTSPARVGVFGVTPSFFDAFGMTAREGRLLREGDDDAGDPAVVLSPDLAREAFPGGRALGGRIRLLDASGRGVSYRVVGVAMDPYRDGARRAWAWVPIESRDPKTFFVALRAARGDGLALGPALRNAVHSADPELSLDGSMVGPPVYSLGQMLAYVGRFYRTTGWLAILGAVGAVLVALLGVYGIVALDLRRRTREMGIRMALGSARAGVAARMLRRGVLRVTPGLALGMVLAWLAAPLFGLFAAGGDPRDPRLLGLAVAGYLLATLAAVAPTALRAGRLDPAAILRDEG